MSPFKTLDSLRRARPFLGTIVEMKAGGETENVRLAAIEAGYAAVAKVQRLMSFHDPASDLQRLHREAVEQPVTVDEWTWEVLSAAQELSARSHGIFDITIANRLQQMRYLPGKAIRHRDRATWKDLQLLRRNQVRFLRPLRLDLGGIAKGFAVDRAVLAMEKCGVEYGIVNAGGDLKIFGPHVRKIHLRHPASPQFMGGYILLSKRAMATSAIYFSQKRLRGKSVSPLLDGRTLSPCLENRSVSVLHSEAMMADALTKVLTVMGGKATPLLNHYGAEAFCLKAGKSFVWVNENARTRL